MIPACIGRAASSDARAQANLVGFAVAVLVVASVTVAGGALANDALSDADRQPATAHAAGALADHLVDASASHTRGANDLRRAAVSNLSAPALDAAVPPIRDRPVRVALGDDVLVERGNVGDGSESVLVERRVLVTRTVRRGERVDLGETREVVVDDHDGRLTVEVDPTETRRVTTVSAGGRIVLHDPAGLDGRYAVAVPRQYPLRIAFDSSGFGSGTATLEWTARNASAERLAVTVGA
ncbi:DUF7263 family protein [Halobellus rufus]|uniref:DUF7263 family protein n=1 Tax=Halobellus rufus TaxID=1448860 RepID=UPI0006798B2C|nr:hypothetical protein [Halobellus rufus]